MTTKKAFSSIGAIVLAFSSGLAISSTPKSNLSAIYVSTAGGTCKQLTMVMSVSFTTGGAGCQASLKTTGCIVRRKLWATNNCAVGAKPVHFHG